MELQIFILCGGDIVKSYRRVVVDHIQVRRSGRIIQYPRREVNKPRDSTLPPAIERARDEGMRFINSLEHQRSMHGVLNHNLLVLLLSGLLGLLALVLLVCLQAPRVGYHLLVLLFGLLGSLVLDSWLTGLMYPRAKGYCLLVFVDDDSSVGSSKLGSVGGGTCWSVVKGKLGQSFGIDYSRMGTSSASINIAANVADRFSRFPFYCWTIDADEEEEEEQKQEKGECLV